MRLVIQEANNRTEGIMKKLVKKWEDIMVAVTFAEAGEFDEACRCTGEAADREEESAVNGRCTVVPNHFVK
jgi:hypothetical protein